MKQILKQTGIIFTVALVLGLIYNFFIIEYGINPFSNFGDPDAHKDDVRRVDLNWLIEAFENRTAVIIDVRDGSEYEAGHIPGALSAPYFYMEDSYAFISKKIKLENTIVLYGHNLSDLAPVRTADYYEYLNFREVKIFLDGIEKWEVDGLPLDTGDKNDR